MPTVYSIVYTPDDGTPNPDDRYYRVPVSPASLVVDRGIQGDRKASSPTRQLNVMSAEVLAAQRGLGFKTEPGQMGEQIVLSGVDLGTLAEGDRLQLGGSAVIEYIKPRTGCSRFEHVQGKLASEAAGGLGFMGRVVTGGEIRVGDAVRVLSATPA